MRLMRDPYLDATFNVGVVDTEDVLKVFFFNDERLWCTGEINAYDDNILRGQETTETHGWGGISYDKHNI